MKKFISVAATAITLASATLPIAAFAETTDSSTANTVRIRGHFSLDADTMPMHTGRPSRRSIRQDRDINGIDTQPLGNGEIGTNATYGEERGATDMSKTGRDLLRLRSSNRWDTLRNANRSRKCREESDTCGYNANELLRSLQGDNRRRPLGLLSPVPEKTETESTGNHPNWRRWARGNEDARNARTIDR